MERDALVRLHTSDGGDVLVFVHPASGSAGGFRRLQPHLDQSQTVFAFEAAEPGPDEGCSIPAVARDYLAELEREISPAGAVLVGWSFGGAVAIEMAGLLERSGVRPKAVVLLDSATPGVLNRRRRTRAEELADLFGVAAEALPHNASEQAALIRIAEELSRTSRTTVQPDDLAPFADTHGWHIRAVRAGWTPLPTTVPITLIRAEDETGWTGCPADLGWAELLGREVELRWTGGTHNSITDRGHVAALADVLTRSLPTGATR